jgi:hypothetical protein
VNTGGIWQFTKGKCKESAADWVKSHIVLRNSNPLHCIYMKCTMQEDALMFCQFGFSIAKKIATQLLAALISTCSGSTSTSTTSTDSRPINFDSKMGHKKTYFVWQES